jgi:hypothetical protein
MAEIDQYCDDLKQTMDSLKVKVTVSSVTEAEETIKTIRLMIAKLSPIKKAKYLDIIKPAEAKLEEYRRVALFTKEDGTLLHDDESEETTQVLLDARAKLKDTIVVGAHTAQELQRQGEVIVHAKQNTKKVNSSVNTSNRLLTRIMSLWRS